MPRQAAVILVDPDNEVARVLLARLDEGCLQLRRPHALIAIVPDSSGPGRRERIAATLTGTGAVVGTTVPLDRLPASLRVAELAVRIRRAQMPEDDPLFVEDHLDTLIVHRDQELVTALRRQALAPLAALARPKCERLSATLISWLMHMGDQQAVAAELHVHPQTVRYRLGQLRALFGPAMDDPASRARLLLALRWGPAEAERDWHGDRPATRPA